MAHQKIKEILDRYTEKLNFRRIHESALPVTSPEGLFNRCQTLYLEKILKSFQEFLKTDNLEVIRKDFTQLVSDWQRILGDSALGYLAAPAEDPMAPDAPANECYFELFQTLFPHATTADFLKAFFPDATSLIHFGEPVVEARRVQITHEIISLSAEAINEHPITTLIIKNNIVLRATDVLSGSPDVLCQYVALLRVEYPDHYAQLIEHNDHIQALYKQVSLLNDSVTLNDAIIRLRATLCRYGSKVTNNEHTLKPGHAIIVSRAVREFQDYLAQYEETPRTELTQLKGEGSITLQSILNNLSDLGAREQCIEQAAGWLSTIQQNGHNKAALASVPRLSDEIKRDIKETLSNQAQSISPVGRNPSKYLPLNFLEPVIAQMQVNSLDQAVSMFEHFTDEVIYESFLTYNAGLKKLVLLDYDSANLTTLLICLTPQQQQYLIRVLIKQRALKSISEAWKLIKIVSTTEEQASRLLAEFWQAQQPLPECLPATEIGILFHLPSSERCTFQNTHNAQIQACLNSPEHFNEILIPLTPVICEWVCKTYKQELSNTLNSTNAFNKVFLNLDPNQLSAVCEGCAPLLRQITYGHSGAVELVDNLKQASISIIFTACCRLDIPVIPTAQAFVFLLQKIPDCNTPLFVVFSKQLPKIIGSLDDFIIIAKHCLLYDEIKKLFASCSEQLQASIPSLQTAQDFVSLLEQHLDSKRALFTVYFRQLPQLIHSMEDFQNIKKNIPNDPIKEFAGPHIEELEKHIITAEDFESLFQYLSPEKAAERYRATPDRWIKLIHSAQSFAQITRYVPTYCTEIYQACRETLKKEMKTTEDARSVLNVLKPEECVTLFCQDFSEQSVMFIPSTSALCTLWQSLQPEALRTICTTWRTAIAQVLSTVDDLVLIRKKSCIGHIGWQVFSEIFLAELLKLLSTPQILFAFFHNTACIESDYYSIFSNHIRRMITTAADFKTAYSKLTLSEGAAFYSVFHDWISSLVKTADDFITLASCLDNKNVDNQQLMPVFSTVHQRLAASTEAKKAFIQNAKDFHQVMSILSQEKRNQLYEIYRSDLPHFIKTITDFNHVLEFLNPEQRTAVFSACKHRLSAVIASIQTADELCTLLAYLAPTDATSIAALFMSKLPHLITSVSILVKIIKNLFFSQYLSTSEGWSTFCHAIRSKLPDIMINNEASSAKTGNINPSRESSSPSIGAQLTAAYFCEVFQPLLTLNQFQDLWHACKEKFSSVLGSFEKFTQFFGKAPSEEPGRAYYLVIYDILQSEYIKYIKSVLDFRTAFSLTPSDRLHSLCDSLGPKQMMELVPTDDDFLALCDKDYYSADIKEKREILIHFFGPAFFMFFVDENKNSPDKHRKDIYIEGSTFFEDIEVCKQLRDRFLALYAKKRSDARWFDKKSSSWPNIVVEPGSRKTFSSIFAKAASATPDNLPTLKDILDHVRKKQLQKKYKPKQASCRTMQVLKELVEELKHAFLPEPKTTLRNSPE